MLIILKRATVDDALILLEIEKTTIGQKTYSGYFTEEHFTEEKIRSYINESVIYLIKKDNLVVGNISYEIKSENCAYISDLVIKPEFQKQGVAREAMRKILEELKGYKKIDIVVHPDNVGAVKLYKSFGFIEEARKENYYGDGEPRLIFELKN